MSNLLFHMCFGISILNPFRLNTLMIPIKNLKGLRTHKTHARTHYFLPSHLKGPLTSNHQERQSLYKQWVYSRLQQPSTYSNVYWVKGGLPPGILPSTIASVWVAFRSFRWLSFFFFFNFFFSFTAFTLVVFGCPTQLTLILWYLSVVFHDDKYQRYKYEKIQQGNLLPWWKPAQASTQTRPGSTRSCQLCTSDIQKSYIKLNIVRFWHYILKQIQSWKNKLSFIVWVCFIVLAW